MQQSQQSQQQTHSSQPTYLSVSTQHEHQPSSAGYSVTSTSQHGGNKTIVLAIPAKINFLTDGRASSSSGKQSADSQHGQQLAVLQAPGEQQPRAEYATKQLGELPLRNQTTLLASSLLTGLLSPVPINSQEGLMDHTGALIAREPGAENEQQQYVLVNPASTSGEQSAQLLSPAGQVQQAGQIYPGLYSAVQHQPAMAAIQPFGPYSMKYLPTYQTAAIQNPTIQKIYSPSETPVSAYEPQQGYDQPTMPSGRFGSGCLDTCNSADVRWRKHSVSKYKYCCSRSSQYDATFDQSSGSSEKVAEPASKSQDDAYYSYLYRRSKSRRSRKPQRLSRFRYSQPAPSTMNNNEEESGPNGDNSESGGRTNQPRPYYGQESSRYYRGRASGSTSSSGASPSAPSSGSDASELSGNEPSQQYRTRYPSKERSGRRGRSRDLESQTDSPLASQEQSEEEMGSTGYGAGDYSVDSVGRYAMEPRSPSQDEDDSRLGYDEQSDQEQPNKTGSMAEGQEYPSDGSDGLIEEGEYQPDMSTGSRPAPSIASGKRRKAARGRSKKSGKDNGNKSQGRKSRRVKHTKVQSQDYSTSQTNATDFESTQVSDQHQPDHSSSSPSSGLSLSSSQGQSDDEQQSSHPAKELASSHDNADGAEKEPISIQSKYKSGLNDSAVVSLSRTTMHLKEILSILERKAQLKMNETSSANQATSTPAPPTTTTSIYSSLPLFSSQYSNPSLQSALSSDYLMSDLSLKSPYKFDPSSLASFSSPSLSLPSSFSSLTSDSFSPLSGFGSSQYGLGSTKQLSSGPQRKKRVNKNVRYSNLMLPKTQGLGSASSLLQAANKSPFLGQAYYPSLQYPYWYSRTNSASVTNPYPYKTLSKSPYSTSFGSPLSSKLASSALYGDDYRLSGLSSFDPIATVASSLRPSTTMRFRAKPFVFQPHVGPIYTRHSILTQNPDLKK